MTTPALHKPDLSEEDLRELHITNARLGRFHQDRQGVTVEQMREWQEAKRKNPDTPWPKPTTIT